MIVINQITLKDNDSSVVCICSVKRKNDEALLSIIEDLKKKGKRIVLLTHSVERFNNLKESKKELLEDVMIYDCGEDMFEELLNSFTFITSCYIIS